MSLELGEEVSTLLFLRRIRTESIARPLAAVVSIVLLTVLVRLPFFSNVGVDEAFFLVVGRQWLEGTPPYVGTFDVKPPLLFALMAGAEAIFGPTLLAAKILTTTAVGATACGLFLFGRRFAGEIAGGAGALMYIASTLMLGGTCSPAELLMAPFITFGVLIILPVVLGQERGPTNALLLAGFCFGAAACVKQTAIFEAASLAAFLFLAGPINGRVHSIGLFAAGFCAVPAAFALFFLSLGHLDVLIDDVVVSAAGRMSAEYVPWGEVFIRVLIELMLVLPIAVMAALYWAVQGASRTVARRLAVGAVAAWTAGALIGVLALRAMCGYYMLAALPPLCLAAGLFFQNTVDRCKHRRVCGAALMAIVLLFFRWAAADLIFTGGDFVTAADAAAAAMKKAGLRSEHRILVADRDLLIYLATGSNPPTSVFHPLQLRCDFALPYPLPDFLASRPLFIVTADPPVHLSCEKHDRRASLDATLAKDYCQLGRFGSIQPAGFQPGAFIVYGLKQQLGSPCREPAIDRAAG